MGKLSGRIWFLEEDELEKIHDNSLNILSDIGFHVPDTEILELLESNGCRVDFKNQTVKTDAALIEKAIKNITGDFSVIPISGKTGSHLMTEILNLLWIPPRI